MYNIFGGKETSHIAIKSTKSPHLKISKRFSFSKEDIQMVCEKILDIISH